MCGSKEEDWFVSAELPVLFTDLLAKFHHFNPLLNSSDSNLIRQMQKVESETIPLSSTHRDDHVKGHIKMRGPLVTKTELSIEINNTPVPIKTVVSIKEEEHNPWRLYQLGHAANYLVYARRRCETLTKGTIRTVPEARRTLDALLEDLKRCKLQFVLPRQSETTSTFNRNHCVFCPALPPGLLVNFHIRDVRLVLTISCLKNPQDLHVKDKYSLPKNAYCDRTILLSAHWMSEIYERITELQNQIQLVYQKLGVFRESRDHVCSSLLVNSG